jgi:hypothetical protein
MDEQRSRFISEEQPPGEADRRPAGNAADDDPPLPTPTPLPGSGDGSVSPGRLDAGPSLWVGPPAVSEPPLFTGSEHEDLEDWAPEEDPADVPDGAAGAVDPLDDWGGEPRTWHDRWRGSLPGVIAGAAVVISFSLVLAAGPKHRASRVASGRPAPTTATTAVAGGAAPTLPPGPEAPALPGPPAEVAAPDSGPGADSGTAVHAAAIRPVAAATPPKPRPATPVPAPPQPATTTGDTAPPSTPPTTDTRPPVDTTTAPTTTVMDEGDDGPPAGCIYFPNLPGC